MRKVMEYQNKRPVLKPDRHERDASVRDRSRADQDRRGKEPGQPDKRNQLGITQGQNGEQGNSSDPRNTQPIGRPGEE